MSTENSLAGEQDLEPQAEEGTTKETQDRRREKKKKSQILLGALMAPFVSKNSNPILAGLPPTK